MRKLRETLIIAAVLMVSLGVSGTSGVIAVLGVAAVVCVSSAVAGELLQDFKVGYILGGTPRTTDVSVGKGSRRRSSSWGSCIAVDGPERREGSRYVGTRSASASGPSSKR